MRAMASTRSECDVSEDIVLTANMDLEEGLDLAEAAGIDNVGMDFRELVDSIYNDRRIFPGPLPESPPDSGSEHLLSPHRDLSPANDNYANMQQQQQQQQQQQHLQQHYGAQQAQQGQPQPPQGYGYHLQPHHHHVHHAHHAQPDLSSIDYTVPLQLIEGNVADVAQTTTRNGITYQTLHPASASASASTSYGGDPSQLPLVILPQRGDQHGHRVLTTLEAQPHLEPQPRSKRRRKDTQQADNMDAIEVEMVKSEPCTSPDSSYSSPSLSLLSPNSAAVACAAGSLVSAININFRDHQPEVWHTLATRDLRELATPSLTVSADKGFNFSTPDDAFIAQKKNHFQLTCHVQFLGAKGPSGGTSGPPSPASAAAAQALEPYYVRTPEGSLKEISHLQLDFYGIKLEVPNSYIRVEQSQADRSKVAFHPVRVEMKSDMQFKVSVGRLHFTETTANNMRKKGKPNPAQKYFQLVVGLEAVVAAGTSRQKEYTLVKMASDRIIVRASNPGQFEPDCEASWCREPGTETLFYMGNVGINTDQASEALSVHGNIQVSGQILQPSDLRIKDDVRELDTRAQLHNVKKLKIVQYVYRPEYLNQFREDGQQVLEQERQTGVIAQDVQRVIPDAVTTSGSFVTANGNKINDMLIVNKDRLFLENIGAVRELSKMTDELGDRIQDLERANESVSVRLSKLRRGGSVSSFSSTSSGKPMPSRRAMFSKRASAATRSIFSHRWVQMLTLGLIVLMAVSLSVMAVMYILDYARNATKAGTGALMTTSTLPGDSGLLNSTDYYAINDVDGDLDLRPQSTASAPVTTTASSGLPWSTSTTRPIALTPPIIGVPTEYSDCVINGACRSFCCEEEAPVSAAATANDPANLTSEELANAILGVHSEAIFQEEPSSLPDFVVKETKLANEFSPDELSHLIKPEDVIHGEEPGDTEFVDRDKEAAEAADKLELKSQLENDPKWLEKVLSRQAEEGGEASGHGQGHEAHEELSREPRVESSVDSGTPEKEVAPPVSQTKVDHVDGQKQLIGASVTVEPAQKNGQASRSHREDMEEKLEFDLDPSEDIWSRTKVPISSKPEKKTQDDLIPVALHNGIEAGKDVSAAESSETNSETRREVRLLDVKQDAQAESEHHTNGTQSADHVDEDEDVEVPAGTGSKSKSPAEDSRRSVVGVVTGSETAANATGAVVAAAGSESGDGGDLHSDRVPIAPHESQSVSRRHAPDTPTIEKPVRRRRRATEDSPKSLSYPVLRTQTDSYTLDEAFCDPQNLSAAMACRRGFHTTSNISLALPLSKYLSASQVVLEFPADTVMCAPAHRGPACFEARAQDSSESEPGLVGRSFVLDAGARRSAAYVFRQATAASAAATTPELCLAPADRIGAAFKEYNVFVYRVCHR